MSSNLSKAMEPWCTSVINSKDAIRRAFRLAPAPPLCAFGCTASQSRLEETSLKWSVSGALNMLQLSPRLRHGTQEPHKGNRTVLSGLTRSGLTYSYSYCITGGTRSLGASSSGSASEARGF